MNQDMKRICIQPLVKKRAFEYKDNIRCENLRVAIINQIKNPPEGFEEFTINHFKAKKDEIIKIANEWKNESNNNKLKIEAFIKQFQELILIKYYKYFINIYNMKIDDYNLILEIVKKI